MSRYDFDKKSKLVTYIWDRLRTLIGAKVNKIRNKDDLEKVAKRYKSLSKYEKSGLIRRSNIFTQVKANATYYRMPYQDKNGRIHRGQYVYKPIRWTEDEIALIKKYKSSGRTINQMSAYTGRTPESIKAKLRTIK